jgi:hypothetical protein
MVSGYGTFGHYRGERDGESCIKHYLYRNRNNEWLQQYSFCGCDGEYNTYGKRGLGSGDLYRRNRSYPYRYRRNYLCLVSGNWTFGYHGCECYS